jgi:pyruvate/2-oxoglutarate dehydrogenase complex dihydrolipoamide dehydrogenase (E3) component
MPGLAEVPYLTNSSIMDVDFLPEHLIVIGGSYIGLEFAQMYRRFGSRVTVVENCPRIIVREDQDVSEGVAGILAAEGIAIETRAECMALSKSAGEISVSLDCEDGKRVVTGSHVLLAVGRRPNTDDLGLDRAGVATDARGFIVVDDMLRTNVSGIMPWARSTPAGVHAHRVQRLRDRGGQPPVERGPQACATGSTRTRCSSIRRWDASG